MFYWTGSAGLFLQKKEIFIGRVTPYSLRMEIDVPISQAYLSFLVLILAPAFVKPSYQWHCSASIQNFCLPALVSVLHGFFYPQISNHCRLSAHCRTWVSGTILGPLHNSNKIFGVWLSGLMTICLTDSQIAACLARSLTWSFGYTTLKSVV